MNDRTKYLLIAMGIVGLFWLGDMGYRGLVEGPAEARARDLNRVEKSLKDAKQSIIDSADAIDKLQLLRTNIITLRSRKLARAAYQDWLLDLVQKSKLTGASVDASQPASVKIKDRDTKKPKENFTCVIRSLCEPAGVSSKSANSCTTFIRAVIFTRSIRFLSTLWEAVAKSISAATIEALGLTRCERKGELSRERFQRLASTDFGNYQLIARRNLFRADTAMQL